MGDQVMMLFLFFFIVLILLYKILSNDHYAEEHLLGPGTYRIGEDLPPGKGDLLAVSGGGSFGVMEKGRKEWNHFHNLGITSPTQPSRFRNLSLHKGDILEINGNVSILITPPSRIRDITKENLTIGNYRFGVDIPPGKYDLEAVSGDGPVSLTKAGSQEYTFYQDMAADNSGKAAKYSNLLCEAGNELWIEGTLQIKLTFSKKPHIWM